MTRKPNQLWTIDELSARAARALAEGSAGQANGRVREIPDRRTIRYYTTLGLIDRPAEMRGRTAYYGLRHLLQIVAIKRLQASGLALAEIQEKLLGLPDALLGRLARLPIDPEASGSAGPQGPPVIERGSGDFWSTSPAPIRANGVSGTERDAAAEAEASALPARMDAHHDCGDEQEIIPLQGIRLASAVTLVVAANGPVSRDDLEAIRIAAAPLLKVLERRRLIRPRPERGTP